MRFLALVAMLGLAACVATPQIIVSEPAPEGPATLRTFEFRSSEVVVESGSRGRRADAQVAEKVRRALGSKGYVEAQSGNPADFYVTYRVAVFLSESPRDPYESPRDPTTLIGRDPAPDAAGVEGLVRQATLVLMAQAPADDRVLWQGQASGVAASRAELSTGAMRAIDHMLRQFPARAP